MAQSVELEASKVELMAKDYTHITDQKLRAGAGDALYDEVANYLKHNPDAACKLQNAFNSARADDPSLPSIDINHGGLMIQGSPIDKDAKGLYLRSFTSDVPTADGCRQEL